MAINKRKVLDAARKYAQKGAQAKAQKEFDKLLKLDPRDARLRLEIGDAHRRWGNAAEAIETYTRVAEQYTKEGFDARAVAVYKQIHHLKPDAYDSYAPLADLYQRMGLDSEAILALQTAADGYHKEGKKGEALELLRKMATLDPTNTTSRIKVADLLRHEGLNEEAICEYEEAGAELERQGDVEAATGVYERILEVEPDRRGTLVKLAEKLVERGLGDRAEAYVKRVLEAEPDEPARYELMAAVYRLQHRDEELTDLYRTLADLHRRRGDDEQAREILQRYVPAAEFEEEEVGLDDQTAFGAMDSAVALSEASEPAPEEMASGPVSFIPLSESQPLDSPGFDPDAPSALGADALETDDGDYLSIETDAEPLELELDDAVDSPTVQAAAAASDSDGDSEQLLAETNVYLRYGKREQAVANLEIIIERNAHHRVALEKLGEIRAEAGEEAQAIEAWLQAAEAARSDGDFEAISVLRDRIAAIDPEAAKNLGPPVPVDAVSGAPASVGMNVAGSRVPAEGEATVVSFDSFEAPDPNADSNTMSDSAREIDLDDIEIDIDDSEFAEEIPGIAHDEDDDLDAVDDDAVASLEPAAAEGDSGDTLDVGMAASGDSEAFGPGASAAMVQQIGEDLEEADFYMNQGLADEAEVIYKRVLSIAPNHPHALVRLGEVAAQRGDDPSTSHREISGSVEIETGPDESGVATAEPSTSFREDIPGPDDAELSSPEDSLSLTGSESVPESTQGSEQEQKQEQEPEPEEEVEDDFGSEIAFESGAALEAESEWRPDESNSEFDGDLAGATASDETTPDSDLEDQLASHFLAEVTESTGIEAARNFDSEDAVASAELPSSPVESMDEDPVVSDAGASDSREFQAFEPESIEPEAGEPPTTTSDAVAADIASPDDSFEESGVDLGEAPEIAEPDPMETSDSDSDSNSDSKWDGGVESVAADCDAGFDLAAELSDVFDDDDGNSGSGLGDSDDGFAAVFSEFKKGVSRTLSENDHEAHFDLGIAYREMGLFDDAKGEFRAAMLNSEREIQGRHMLGLCCIEQEHFEEAIAEFEQIAAAADATDEQQLSAQFELGRAFEALGDIERARISYEAVAEVDPTFCNVRGRLEKIDSPSQPAAETSGIESFDDLIADVESASDGPEEAASEYESFGDLVAETESEDEAERVASAAADSAEIDSFEVDSNAVDFNETDGDSNADSGEFAAGEAVDVAEDSGVADETPEPPRPRKRNKISFV